MMTNQKIIENKISQIKKYLNILDDYRRYSAQEMANDIVISAVVERYLYLVVQATIDLGEAFIAYKKLRKPATYKEVFEILSEKGLISNELADKLQNMSGFRNVLAHVYDQIDYHIVCEVLQNGLEDVEKFVKIAEKKIQR
ncbi:DUF86 domain-containing protein [Patescibacteria group bacterium]|nr:DUF86 domain-containing protein [Patescibacteria group bacterium]